MHPFGKCVRWGKTRVPKGCNFITLQALILQLYYYYCILLFNYMAIFDTSAKRCEAHVLKWCIKNCSIVKRYNKVVIITNVCTGSSTITSKPKINVFEKKFLCSAVQHEFEKKFIKLQILAFKLRFFFGF